MPAPNVFISSTFYDLRYIRESLRSFVRNLGYHPILNEKGAIYYDPDRSAPGAAVAEVSSCHLFVLIVGGRFGSEMPDTGHSVTNAEYREAVRRRVPIFALVEQGTYSDYEVWCANPERDDDSLPINYPNVDDARVLRFVDEVRNQAVNNALFSFRDFEDIQSYLRQQWAGMLHAFLVGRGEAKREEKLEMLERQVDALWSQVKPDGSAHAKPTADGYGAGPPVGARGAVLLEPKGWSGGIPHETSASRGNSGWDALPDGEDVRPSPD
jgi:hypothetical protein